MSFFSSVSSHLTHISITLCHCDKSGFICGFFKSVTNGWVRCERQRWHRHIPYSLSETFGIEEDSGGLGFEWTWNIIELPAGKH